MSYVWSTPRTWAVGELLTATNMNAYISQNLGVLAPPDASSSPSMWTLWDSTVAGVSWPTASVTTPSLSQSYKHLMVEWVAASSTAVAWEGFDVRWDGATSGYYGNYVLAYGSTISNNEFINSSAAVAGYMSAGSGGAASTGYGTIWFSDYTNTSVDRHYHSSGGVNYGLTTGEFGTFVCNGLINGSLTINTLTFLPSGAGNLTSRTRITVYGIS